MPGSRSLDERPVQLTHQAACQREVVVDLEMDVAIGYGLSSYLVTAFRLQNHKVKVPVS